MTEVALTIAGSDSGGGAGIQADLKTFAMHFVHGTSAITCVTAQNTVGVEVVEAMNPAVVEAQIEAIAGDLQVKAVKTGMLLNSEIMAGVAKQLEKHRFDWLVVDPVMVSRTGVRLIDDLAIASLQILVSRADLVTPNRYEAQILSGLTVDTLAELQQAAIIIYQRFGTTVLAKGGSLGGSDRSSDVWYDGKVIKTLFTKTIDTNNTHGTGCTLSAAICANLALGKELGTAVADAKDYVTKALEHSLAIGRGNGPVGHYFPLLERGRTSN